MKKLCREGKLGIFRKTCDLFVSLTVEASEEVHESRILSVKTYRHFTHAEGPVVEGQETVIYDVKKTSGRGIIVIDVLMVNKIGKLKGHWTVWSKKSEEINKNLINSVPAFG